MRPPTSFERADGPIRLEVVSKPDGGSRLLAHLPEGDRRRYEAAVAAVTPRVERALGVGVLANRARTSGPRLELEPWRLARRRYERGLRAATNGPGRAAFVGDVRDCYRSIRPATVDRALVAMGETPDRIERLTALLRSFEARGARGLPIGPAPSAVLANAVLAPVDAALVESGDGPAYRWVDDVVVLTADVARARRVAHAFRRALSVLGLSANESKCRITDDPFVLVAAASTTSISCTPRRGMMRAP
jgi:hypothetical protein